MNEGHKVCGSDEWRALIRDEVLPWALGDRDLGDDVLEVGPGYGATTDVLCGCAAHLTAVEIDPELVVRLRKRFADTPGVEIVEGDATGLQFPDGRFSGAASFTMLHHVPTASSRTGCSQKCPGPSDPVAYLPSGTRWRLLNVRPDMSVIFTTRLIRRP